MEDTNITENWYGKPFVSFVPFESNVIIYRLISEKP
jgi:hypothetical protein